MFQLNVTFWTYSGIEQLVLQTVASGSIWVHNDTSDDMYLTAPYYMQQDIVHWITWQATTWWRNQTHFWATPLWLPWLAASLALVTLVTATQGHWITTQQWTRGKYTVVTLAIVGHVGVYIALFTMDSTSVPSFYTFVCNAVPHSLLLTGGNVYVTLSLLVATRSLVEAVDGIVWLLGWDAFLQLDPDIASSFLLWHTSQLILDTAFAWWFAVASVRVQSRAHILFLHENQHAVDWIQRAWYRLNDTATHLSLIGTWLFLGVAACVNVAVSVHIWCGFIQPKTAFSLPGLVFLWGGLAVTLKLAWTWLYSWISWTIPPKYNVHITNLITSPSDTFGTARTLMDHIPTNVFIPITLLALMHPQDAGKVMLLFSNKTIGTWPSLFTTTVRRTDEFARKVFKYTRHKDTHMCALSGILTIGSSCISTTEEAGFDETFLSFVGTWARVLDWFSEDIATCQIKLYELDRQWAIDERKAVRTIDTPSEAIPLARH
jgi:hypothetical protein